MPGALLVTYSDKSIAFFTEMLRGIAIDQITTVQSCQEARRLASQRDFSLCIINAPLPDETGEALAVDFITAYAMQVILVVKAEQYEAVSLVVEDAGVLTVSKPISRTLFWAALKMAKAAQARVMRMQKENTALVQKIEDIRMIDRAKCVLISYLHMTEHDAHKYIEKSAMDLRLSRREVAQNILKTYEN